MPLARVIVLAGPSGSGKSRLASRLGLPVLSLDDFYRDADAPALPRLPRGVVGDDVEPGTADGDAGRIDWDHPASWDRDQAVETLRALCVDGSADVPVYDISASRRTGHRRLGLDGSRWFVAEGIFAAEVVADLRRDGLLGAAVCVRHRPLVTFTLRLVRDLREQRKAPHLLVRRGWWLMRGEPDIVARMQAHGCVVMSPRRAEQMIRRLIDVG